MADLKVGGEVDCMCTRCKMVLAHTVMAIWAGEIKKVRCNTCMGEHGYRRAAAAASAPKASKPAKPRASSASAGRKTEGPQVSASYVELLEGKERSSARRYALSERFAAGDLIEHPSFGLGVVAAVRGVEKIDVAFPNGVKTLMHNRGAAPSFARPPAPKESDVEVPTGKVIESDDDEDEVEGADEAAS